MRPAIDRRRVAEELLHLSKEMLSAMRENRWEELAEMQERRERVIAALFDDLTPGCVSDDDWISIVRDVQVLNGALVELALRERDRAAGELTSFKASRKADAAYLDVMNRD